MGLLFLLQALVLLLLELGGPGAPVEAVVYLIARVRLEERFQDGARLGRERA